MKSYGKLSIQMGQCKEPFEVHSDEIKAYLNNDYPFAMIKWIRAQEKKPEHGKRVLLCDFTEWMYVGFYNENTKKFEHCAGEEPGVDVTHWAYLPKVPDGT